MPKNNNLEPIEFPQEVRFGEKPTTEYVNNLDSISVKLVSAPHLNELVSYIPQFVKATWMESVKSCDELDLAEKVSLIQDVFFGRTLPTALETINVVFEIDGISLQEVTHILRHRGASFSADCSADKWWTHKRALVPNAVMNSTGNTTECSSFEEDGVPPDTSDFYGRYRLIVEAAKKLYCDMVDSKEVSILDARYILPRCLETFYYMRMPLKDAIAFIWQRIDRQIQPETDNVLAYAMYLELLKQFPIANGLIDIDAPARHFINTARSGKSSNIYMPEENSDLFEWHENDFIYDKCRDKLVGTDDNAIYYFGEIKKQYDEAIAAQEKANNEYLVEYCGVDNVGLPDLTKKFAKN